MGARIFSDSFATVDMITTLNATLLNLSLRDPAESTLPESKPKAFQSALSAHKSLRDGNVQDKYE